MDAGVSISVPLSTGPLLMDAGVSPPEGVVDAADGVLGGGNSELFAADARLLGVVCEAGASFSLITFRKAVRPEGVERSFFSA